jgi:transcription termination factor Rho
MELNLKETRNRTDGRRRRRDRSAPRDRANWAAKQRQFRQARPVEESSPFSSANGEAPEVAAETLTARGILELHPRGYGFLRDPAADCRPTPGDVFVPAGMITRYGLRLGTLIEGLARKGHQDGPQLVEIRAVDGCPPDDYARVPDFDSLTPINPESWLRLETGPEPLSTRVIDLLVPVGKGQRGLIVAPPRTGKTVLLEQIGQAVAANHPEVALLVLLVDERPEEVTDMRRKIPGQVFASSLDQDVASHVRLSRLVVERCKRLAERGQAVLLLVDSLTRMARAFNKSISNSGRTMSGGLDIKALDVPKKLFATARAFEEGGSLTILATALVETGSRMDELIFEEFKGTGNLELVLDRRLADQRVWPAIDIARSGTRREEKLLPPANLQAANLLRRTVSSMNPVDAMQRLTAQLAKSRSNRQFIEVIATR